MRGVWRHDEGRILGSPCRTIRIRESSDTGYLTVMLDEHGQEGCTTPCILQDLRDRNNAGVATPLRNSSARDTSETRSKEDATPIRRETIPAIP